MLLSELELTIPAPTRGSLIEALVRLVHERVGRDFQPIRISVTSSDKSNWNCEVGGFTSDDEAPPFDLYQAFNFRRRVTERTNQFTTALVIPTGIGAEVGGHAGDAAPVAKLMGQVSDQVVLHPNVVNASDVNEMPANSFYVEGSVLSRLLMGTVGLQPVRSNRVLTVIDNHRDELFINAAVNAVSGARASYGLSCPEVVRLEPPVKLRARFATSGRAAGRVEDLAGLVEALDARQGSFDAVAVSSVIDVPHEFHQGYFDAKGTMVNPWGGVEAMLTHALSSIFNLPTAHSPMFESQEIANADPGIVDPRMAAEAVSVTFLQCTLKGLQRSPRIVTDPEAMASPDVLSAEDISCLVIPDGCLGLPTLAALEQGMLTIAVRENKNIMRNDLTSLPWAPGQFWQVDNYWEAAGLIAAFRAGVDPTSTRRPLNYTSVTISTHHSRMPETAPESTESQQQ